MPTVNRITHQDPSEFDMLSHLSCGLTVSKAPSVLLVEDEVLIRKNLAEELRESHFRVIEAANAEEAWAFIQAGPPPDLVFSDIKMPGSFDGLELAHRIRSDYPAVKVIVTSGNLGLAQRPPGAIFLAKPYRIEHAIETTKRFLGLA